MFLLVAEEGRKRGVQTALRYRVEYKGKRYYVQADSTDDAFNIYNERKVYGHQMFKEYYLIDHDRKTAGYMWALYAVRSAGVWKRVKIVLDSNCPEFSDSSIDFH